MAATTITSMADISARLRADDDTPTPPGTQDANDLDTNAMEISSPSTPTRHSFRGMLDERPLPLDHSRPSQDSDRHMHIHFASDRADSTQPSHGLDDDDMDMAEGDAETIDDEDLSENDSVTSEKPSKKKKGQRFFCTDFPPCQLSFTRSEHLARHIRKHTGERPFQCHCSRRFSRLDNLRQHAQTVHVNEEIPGDSLAATSTRFQRQIRTDRVRPSSSRSRGSTLNGGQTPTHSRGHSRNLSTSSIGSVASSFAMDDGRRRQPALAIATEGLKRSHEMSEDHDQHYPHSAVTSPASQTFSTIGSPGYHNFASPAKPYYGAPRHNRRLSTPSTSNPYLSHNLGYGPGYYTPISSQASVYSSQQTSGYASPSGSIMSPGRRDSETEIEYRRRTWHPSSQSSYNQRPATSGLSYHQTPDQPVPSLSDQPAANQLPRLPGIESFDHLSPASSRPQTDTMMLNAMSRPGTSSHETGIQQGFHRLEITPNRPYEQPWQLAPPGPPPAGPPPPIPYQYQHQHHLSMPEGPITPRRNKRQAWYGGPIAPSPTLLQPQSSSHRPSPEDSVSSDGGVHTPPLSQGQEHHATIINTNEPPSAEHFTQQSIPYNYDKPVMPPRADSGFGPFSAPGPMTALSQQMPQPHPPSSQHYTMQAGHDARFANRYMQSRPDRPGEDMGRLEALVAVATSENRAVEQQR